MTKLRHDIDGDGDKDKYTNGNESDRGGLRDRFEHAVHGFEKPKGERPRRLFQGITVDEKKNRALLIEHCVHVGFSVEQIADFLRTYDLVLTRSQVYEYLSRTKLPRSYRRAESEQSHHDYFTIRFFLRLAKDIATGGFRTRKISKGKIAWPGARFKPDMKWEVEDYLFFLEMQLSDLPETRWSVKLRNYIRLRKLIGRPFRALFVLDQKGDMAYIRRFARELIKVEGNKYENLFMFITLNDFKGSANLARDPVWMNARGERVSLLAYLRRVR